MNDRDNTPTYKRKPNIQTSDDRALSSASRRKATAPALGVPIRRSRPEVDPEEVTSPFDLIERAPDGEVEAVVQRSRRESGDPATFGDVVKLAVALTRERSENRKRNADAEVVLRAPHQAAKSTRRHLIVAIMAAAASVGGAVTKWSEHSSQPGGSSGDAVRVQNLEKAIDRIDRELGEIRLMIGRRSELRVPAGNQPVLTLNQGFKP